MYTYYIHTYINTVKKIYDKQSTLLDRRGLERTHDAWNVRRIYASLPWQAGAIETNEV